MKISYHNYPILGKLESGDISNPPLTNKRDTTYIISPQYFNFINRFSEKSKFFKNEINVISESFFSAVEKANNRLSDLYKNIIEDRQLELNFSCTIIYMGKVIMLNHSLNNGILNYDLFVFEKDGTPLIMAYNSGDNSDCWFSNSLPSPNKHTLFNTILVSTMIYIFKQFADVETKIIKPHETKREIGCKYINDTKLPLVYLDSKWFTNLVKSDAFKVRGHFRLQPCKNDDNEWTKKIIWISEYEKSGYTSKAKILNQ